MEEYYVVIGDIIKETVSRYKDKPAILSENGTVSFVEVNTRANRLANALLDMGLERGDRVTIISRNCNQYREVYLTAAKVGVVSIPINYRLQKDEISYIIDNARPSIVFTQQEYIDALKSVCIEKPFIKDLICFNQDDQGAVKGYEELISAYPADEPQSSVAEDDLFSIMYTSGSTGKPKGVVHTHRSFYTQFARNINYFGDYSKKVFLTVMPLSGHAGGSLDLFYFLSGSAIAMLDHFDATDVFKAIEKYKVTDIFLVPTSLNFFFHNPDFGKYDISSLDTLLYTGSAMPVELLKKVRQSMGNIFVQLYGSSESWGISMLSKEDHTDINAKKMKSVGRPWPDVEIRIVDENDDLKPEGEPGEITVKSDSVMMEYFNLPEINAVTLKNGWYHTGDMGILDEDGYLYVTGRKDEMIISGGLHIYPVEIENVISTHPKVLEVAVIGVPDAQWGESVKAFVVTRDGASVTEEELIELCKSKLASFKKPKSVEFVSSLPKNNSGKIIKSTLKEKYAGKQQ
ncbi:long-chain-fatty-acid--CoA ligase [Chloroflexota bacterium]